ncbi:hypothetical protein H9P43_008856 [Blastocladiella emersonii ATCC 22665]|nr:hypothetical protein H9P43_008856 [Blastocladiella emersonii ATCC 22665]
MRNEIKMEKADKPKLQLANKTNEFEFFEFFEFKLKLKLKLKLKFKLVFKLAFLDLTCSRSLKMMILDYYPARSSTQQQQHIDLDSTDLFSFLIDFIDFIDFIDLIDLMHGLAKIKEQLKSSRASSKGKRFLSPKDALANYFLVGSFKVLDSLSVFEWLAIALTYVLSLISVVLGGAGQALQSYSLLWDGSKGPIFDGALPNVANLRRATKRSAPAAPKPANKRLHNELHTRKHTTKIFPQNTQDILEAMLPHAESDMANTVHVVLVGSNVSLTPEMKKMLTVRRHVVLAALRWLKEHNPYYADIIIDMDRINALPEDGMLPSMESRATRVDNAEFEASERSGVHDDNLQAKDSASAPPAQMVETLFESVGVFRNPNNNDNNSVVMQSLQQLYTIKNTQPASAGGGSTDPPAQVLQVPVGSTPVSEYSVWFMAMAFPVLFPALMFVVNNMILKKLIGYKTRCRVPRALDNTAAATMHGISFATLDTNLELAKQGKTEMRALILFLGLPDFFVTLNSYDVNSPIVAIMAGLSRDIVMDMDSIQLGKLEKWLEFGRE